MLDVMAGVICRNCGFNNEPTEAACIACGYSLSPAVTGQADETAAGVDPGAMTRIVEAVESCWNCGAPNEASRTFCHACGQQLRAPTQAWPAVSAVDRDLPPRLSARGKPRAPGFLAVLGAAALGALFVVAGFVLAGMLGRDGRGDASTASPAAVAAGSPAAGGSPGAAGNGGGGRGNDFSCEPRTLSAAEPAAWTVTRARWGQRPGFDYISFALGRRRSADAAATITAELVPPAEVDTRFGVQPPRGDVALVVTFHEPIGLTGPFGRVTDQRALREFRLVRADGAAHAILGVSGSGCYRLSAPAFETGAPESLDITVEIERP